MLKKKRWDPLFLVKNSEKSQLFSGVPPDFFQILPGKPQQSPSTWPVEKLPVGPHSATVVESPSDVSRFIIIGNISHALYTLKLDKIFNFCLSKKTGFFQKLPRVPYLWENLCHEEKNPVGPMSEDVMESRSVRYEFVLCVICHFEISTFSMGISGVLTTWDKLAHK